VKSAPPQLDAPRSDALKGGVVSLVLFRLGWSGYQLLYGIGSHADGRRASVHREDQRRIIIRLGVLGEVYLYGIGGRSTLQTGVAPHADRQSSYQPNSVLLPL
jgi:hypothetical protein